ncbi:MAG: T9SS type A sorting domain-containing protein [Bacteroidales bacterium]|jgi:hypothetical protein|nr:T9SS type A sorting domain-containing protein [Bacteroidales bacterium]
MQVSTSNKALPNIRIKEGVSARKRKLFNIALFLFILVFVPFGLCGQTTYTWDGSSGTLWTTAANWTPDRTTPATNDILVFNNGSTIIINDVPSQTIGRLQVTGNTNITLRPSTGSSSTLTVSAAANDAISVASGSTLTVSGRDATTDRTLTLTTTNTSGLQVNISGKLMVTRDNNQAGAAGSFTKGGSNAVIRFNSGSIYEHNVNGGSVPLATWDISSLCLITGIAGTAPVVTTFNQAFGNFTWNCTAQTVNVFFSNNFSLVNGTFTMASTGPTGRFRPGGSVTYGNFIMSAGDYRLTQSGTNTLRVRDDFTMTGGTLRLTNSSGVTGIIDVSGDFTHTAGTITDASAGTGAIIFRGPGEQFYTSGGTLSNNINITVSSGATLQMGSGASPSYFTGSTGTFTLSSGATLGITSPVGISSTGATGNVQVTGTRTFDSGANYTYNGSGAQVTGSGLPTVAISGNVTIAAGSTVTTTNPVIVDGSLNIGGTLGVGTNELTVNNLNHSGKITISSTALDVNGSMIVTGNIVQDEGSSVSFGRQLRTETNAGDLHFFSSPVTANTEVNSGKITDVWLWDEVTGNWATIAITSLASGRAYNVDQTSSSDGNITFTGSLVTSDLVIDATSPYNDVIDGTEENYDSRTFTDATGHSGVVRSLSNYGGGGWNMLGNPFTSAMEVSAFIDANYSSTPADNNFDPNYVALYLYDGTTGTYYYVSNSTGWPDGTDLDEDYIQAGQGFFVLAMNDLSTFTFSRSMQGHDRDVPMLKSTKVSGRWPGLQLTARSGTDTKKTTIVYNEEMSTELDPGYDIGLMSSNSDIALYTSMPFDNGVNYTRQALPVAGADTVIIPLGVDFKKGGEVTFSAVIEPLNNYRFWLEDRATGNFTNLSSGTYTVNIYPETYGTGRFYLHASVSSPTAVQPLPDDTGNDLRIWRSGSDVIIKGNISENASCIIYNLQGQKVIETRLNEGDLNIISMPLSSRGLYLVRLINKGMVTTHKVIFP